MGTHPGIGGDQQFTDANIKLSGFGDNGDQYYISLLGNKDDVAYDVTDKKNKLLGINPGASYGSSKQWYPNKFAEVAIALSSEFDIIIFGGSKEKYCSPLILNKESTILF